MQKLFPMLKRRGVGKKQKYPEISLEYLNAQNTPQASIASPGGSKIPLGSFYLSPNVANILKKDKLLTEYKKKIKEAGYTRILNRDGQNAVHVEFPEKKIRKLKVIPKKKHTPKKQDVKPGMRQRESLSPGESKEEKEFLEQQIRAGIAVEKYVPKNAGLLGPDGKIYTSEEWKKRTEDEN